MPDGRSAVTLYETLETRDCLSLVEVELRTGRTDQIRASFADIGHPLLGDGKYGVGSVNRRYGETPVSYTHLVFTRVRGIIFSFAVRFGALREKNAKKSEKMKNFACNFVWNLLS